jgi:hypothetical protein
MTTAKTGIDGVINPQPVAAPLTRSGDFSGRDNKPGPGPSVDICGRVSRVLKKDVEFCVKVPWHSDCRVRQRPARAGQGRSGSRSAGRENAFSRRSDDLVCIHTRGLPTGDSARCGRDQPPRCRLASLRRDDRRQRHRPVRCPDALCHVPDPSRADERPVPPASKGACRDTVMHQLKVEPLTGRGMEWQTHGARKYPTSALLGSSAALGWSTVAAELRSHGVSETPLIVPQHTEKRPTSYISAGRPAESPLAMVQGRSCPEADFLATNPIPA